MLHNLISETGVLDVAHLQNNQKPFEIEDPEFSFLSRDPCRQIQTWNPFTLKVTIALQDILVIG